MTDTCTRCGHAIGYDCGCTVTERLTAERDLYKARAERAEETLEQNGVLQILLDLGADQCRLTLDPHMGWPDGLSKPLNDPDTGDSLQVAHLDVEDSGYGPRLWDYAISVLKSARETLAQIDAEPAEPRQPTVKPLEWEGYGHWHSGDNEGWMEEASTAFGWGYSIEFNYDGNFMANSTFGWSECRFDTPDEAKAAAQADYERRILSALSEGDNQ